MEFSLPWRREESHVTVVRSFICSPPFFMKSIQLLLFAPRRRVFIRFSKFDYRFSSRNYSQRSIAYRFGTPAGRTIEQTHGRARFFFYNTTRRNWNNFGNVVIRLGRKRLFYIFSFFYPFKTTMATTWPTIRRTLWRSSAMVVSCVRGGEGGRSVVHPGNVQQYPTKIAE